MHLTNDLSLGSLLGWLSAAAGLAFSCGKIATALQAMTTAIQDLRSDFRAHVAENDHSFDRLQDQLLLLKK